jgi:hypothetical protein
MSDNFDNNFPSIETINRFRNNAIWCFAGGIVLVACRFAAGRLPLAVGAGVIICAVGMGWLLANNPVNKRTGAIIIGIGILVLLSGIKISILPVVTATLLSIISIGLLVLGLKNLVRYFAAQSRRR